MRADKLHHLWFGEAQERRHGKSHWQVRKLISKAEAYHSGSHTAYGHVYQWVLKLLPLLTAPYIMNADECRRTL